MGKYVVAVFGQMVLLLETGYQAFLTPLLLDHIYNDSPMIRKQVAKTLRTLLKGKAVLKQDLSLEIKSVVLNNLVENERTT